MPPRKRGRPKESKAASTKVVVKLEKTKGKPSRPKGSKNKKTLAKEAREAKSTTKAVEKRRPGRPKGSRNKATLELMKKQEQTEVVASFSALPLATKLAPAGEYFQKSLPV